MAHAFTTYIYEGEKVIWDWVVNRTVLVFFAVLYTALIRLLYNGVLWLVISTDQTAIDSVHFFVWLFFVLIGLSLAIHFLWLFLKRFVITDKRVLVISWIIWVDVTALVYSQIKNASLEVWLVGMLFRVWDIVIDSWKIYSRRIGKRMSTETKYDTFHYVSSPKEVYAYIQQELIKHT
jgi:hypothetical protein